MIPTTPGGPGDGGGFDPSSKSRFTRCKLTKHNIDDEEPYEDRRIIGNRNVSSSCIGFDGTPSAKQSLINITTTPSPKSFELFFEPKMNNFTSNDNDFNNTKPKKYLRREMSGKTNCRDKNNSSLRVEATSPKQRRRMGYYDKYKRVIFSNSSTTILFVFLFSFLVNNSSSSEVSSFQQQQHSFGSPGIGGTGSSSGLSGSSGGSSSGSSNLGNNYNTNTNNNNNNNNYNNANNNGIFNPLGNNGGSGIGVINGNGVNNNNGGSILSPELQQQQVPLSPIVTSPAPPPQTTPSVLTAYFIIGLANQIRKINSTAMMLLTRGQPFQLQFKTACPFGNIVYDDKFSISINSGGNMTYSSSTKPNVFPFSTLHNVADGQWHAITFTGSSISLDDHELHDHQTEAVQDRHDINWDTNSSSENDQSSRLDHMLHFFDGFVGCIRVPKPTHDHHTGRDHHDLQSHEESFNNQPESPSEYRMLSFLDLFDLRDPYHPCDDTGTNLSTIHDCFEPDTFVLCSKCQNGAVCEPEIAETRNSSDTMNNTCVCPPNTDEIEYSGRYCENPPNSQQVEDSPSHEAEFVMIGGDDSGGSPISSSSNIDATSANLSLSDSPETRMPVPMSNPAEPPVVTTTTTEKPAEVPFDFVTGDECPCQNRGVCTPSSIHAGQHYCECSGYEGTYCEVDINECLNESICNQGICVNSNGSFNCFCRPGYAGKFCNKEFNECLSNPCKNGANCVDRIDDYECECQAGYEGRECQHDINECLSNPCNNGASCEDLLNDFHCTCQEGYTGKNCEINIDDCLSQPCQNEGLCYDHVNRYECDCKDTGFFGDNCEINIDDCALSDFCQNGGTCVDGIKGYNCSCHEGYNGHDCENDFDDCLSSPCKNGECFQKSDESLYSYQDPRQLFNGSSFNYATAAGYICLCNDGYTGENCEVDINECEKHPCGKDGDCIDGIASYRCDCHKGYTGTSCEIEINECDSSPCVNGQCRDRIGDFSCDCLEGYGAKNCSVPLKGCLKNPCSSNGKCEATYDEAQNKHHYNCDCNPGFAGTKCSLETTMSFNGLGPIEMINNDKSYENGNYELLFRFKTTLPDVLLALGQGITYFSLILSAGKLNLQSSLLNNLKGISSGTNLSNAEWHKVWISVNNSHIALAADSEQTIYPISEGQDAHTGFNVTQLGLSTRVGFVSIKGLSPFIGCMQDIMINGERLIPGENLNATSVEIGCKRKDQCNPNPCENFGTCTDLWQNFTCNCQRPYLGDRCQHEYTAATFHHETMNNSLGIVEISQDIANKFSSTFDISMFVRTRNQSATIFLLGYENNGNYSVFLEAEVGAVGNLVVQAKWSDGPEDTNARLETYAVDGLQITDGSPHLISIQRDKGLVKISVNGTEHFRKSVSNKIKFSPTVLYIGGKPVYLNANAVAAAAAQADSAVSISGSGEGGDNGEDSTSHPESTGTGSDASSKENSLTHQRPLTENDNLIVTRPFKGVIQDLRVNFSSTEAPASLSHSQQHAKNQNYYVVEFYPLTLNSTYAMGDPLGRVTIQNLLNGTVSDDTCKVNPCSNDGVCEVTWNDFQCQCADGYDGKTCEVRLHCAMVNCPAGSTCHNIGWTGFECISETAFDGKGTSSPHYRLESTELENVTFNEVSFRFRTKQAGDVLYISNGPNSLRIGLEVDTQSNQSDNIAIYIDGQRAATTVPKILDGQWHSLLAKLSINDDLSSLTLFVDDKEQSLSPAVEEIPSSFLYNLVTSTSTEIVVGSHIEHNGRYHVDHYEMGGNHIGHPEDAHNRFYRGCLSDIKIGDYRLPFVTPSQLEAINYDNVTLVKKTAPTAFYIEETVPGALSPHLGCVLCYDNECSNGGRCDNAPEKYECECPDGFTDQFCSTNIDECLENSCENGSTCVDGIFNYTCICPIGFEGWKCNLDIDECEVEGYPCKNGGTCHNGIPGRYTCECTEDFLGSNCEKRKKSSCKDQPCENDGACREKSEKRPNDATFECICQQGWEGETCSEKIDYCQNVTCANGGTCLTKDYGFECMCVGGYDGPRCTFEIDECLSNPCLHNGSCHNLINSYSCDCDHTGFEGLNCEKDINECEHPEICPVMQRCENLIGSFRCYCPNLSMCGENCDIPDPCFEDGNKTCFNGGKCLSECHDEQNKNWNCDCTENYGGQFCELLTMAQPEQHIDLLLIIIPVLAAFLIAASIGVIILVRMARRKRATRGVYSPSQQEYCNPRVELDNVMKPPPEERLI